MVTYFVWQTRKSDVTNSDAPDFIIFGFNMQQSRFAHFCCRLGPDGKPRFQRTRRADRSPYGTGTTGSSSVGADRSSGGGSAPSGSYGNSDGARFSGVSQNVGFRSPSQSSESRRGGDDLFSLECASCTALAATATLAQICRPCCHLHAHFKLLRHEVAAWLNLTFVAFVWSLGGCNLR